MRKIFLGVIFFWLFANAGAFQILGEGKFLNFSDVHFNPFYDTMLVSELVKAEYTEWENISRSSKL